MLLVSGYEAWYSTNIMSLKSSFDYNKKNNYDSAVFRELLTDSYLR